MISTTEAPLVSVLMTAYNREKYIAEAIESVLASTYKNFELIIVDDGSQDQTVAIARSYEQKDQRVKVYVNEQNLGDYPNRNKAAGYAKGKYIKYVDADDYIYPHGLAVLAETMERFPEAGWGLCSLLQYTKRPYPFQLTPKEAYHYHYFGPGLFHKAPLSSIIKMSAFENENGFKNARMVGDYEMWHRLAMQYPVVLMQDGVVWYREHDEQEVVFRSQFVEAYEEVKYKYLQNSKCPLDKELAHQILQKEKKRLRMSLIKSIVKLNYKSMLMYLRLLDQIK
ncbi:MAG: glycosyltransferase family 2 protein [Bacteroidetes bacterium]|nr:glycosyltransferase family 2 protein [Bacteroidota bacterium]